MASPQSFALRVICVWLIYNTQLIRTDDTVGTNALPVCPPDSNLDPKDGLCVCDLAKCPPPTICEPPAVRTPTRSATGKPGDCCDTVECVNSVEGVTDLKCTGPSCKMASDCPEDSYRLDGVGCKCLPSPCQMKSCPSGSLARIQQPGTNTPGSCCPLYECVVADSNLTCHDNGTQRENGSSWYKPDCTQCRCDGGVIFCDTVRALPSDANTVCSPLPPECTMSRVPPGQCCPVCISHPEELDTSPPPGSCFTSYLGYGKVVLNGSSWQEDDCTSCVCKNGQRQCQAYMCEACANPQYEPGECCPRCNGSTVVTVPSHCPPLNTCSLRCVHGFVRDSNGCFTCHCQQDECVLECQYGFAQDSHGNKLCKCNEPKCTPLTNCRKNCPHGYRINKLGCEVCRCESCKPLDQCTKRCAHGLVVNANNCAICKCIPHNNSMSGINNSSDTSVGTPCISESNVWRDDGETWFDGCRMCYCLAGREMCSLLSCPAAPCPNPIFNSSKDCCPSCPGTDLVSASHMVCQGEKPGKVYLEGETWRLSPCVECLCQSGRALCHAVSCPPTPCARPLMPSSGECCPVCPQDQLNNASLSTSCDRRHGESIWSEGNCVSCLCDEGRPTCFTQLCINQVSCNNALQVKNQCCPICLDKMEAVFSKVCTVDNTTYSVGEDWQKDECTNCMCIAGGEISCTKLVCSVNCPNPVRKPGVCCHVCPDNKSFVGFEVEILYIVIVFVFTVAALVLGLYIARQWKLKRHQLKLPNNYHNCPPPQYTQYKYMPTYDSPQSNTEKSALTQL